MKIKGAENLFTKPSTATVVIRRGEDSATITVTAPSRRFYAKLREKGLLEYPEKKLVEKKAPTGAPLKINGEIQYEEVEPPGYQEAVSTFNGRLLALRLRDVLRADQSVEFDVVEPSQEASKEDWLKYADTLSASITQDGSGLTDDEISTLLEVAEALSDQISVDEAMESFLSRRRQ